MKFICSLYKNTVSSFTSVNSAVLCATADHLQKITRATKEPSRLSRKFYIINTRHSIDRKILMVQKCKAPSKHTLKLFCSRNCLQLVTQLCGPKRWQNVSLNMWENTRKIRGLNAAASNSRHIVVYYLRHCCNSRCQNTELAQHQLVYVISTASSVNHTRW